MMTPTPGQSVGGIPLSVPYWQKDINDRNRYLTDEELDQVLPSEGYEVSYLFLLSLLLSRLAVFISLVCKLSVTSLAHQK